MAGEGRHFMNPQHGAHMRGEAPSGDVEEKSGQHHPPHISIHSHAKGHTVHIMHHDGRHEKHEHARGDVEGIAAHIHKHLGGHGQDHGYSAGAAEEDEFGAGPGV